VIPAGCAAWRTADEPKDREAMNMRDRIDAVERTLLPEPPRTFDVRRFLADVLRSRADVGDAVGASPPELPPQVLYAGPDGCSDLAPFWAGVMGEPK
jgi:hypothetical protein